MRCCGRMKVASARLMPTPSSPISPLKLPTCCSFLSTRNIRIVSTRPTRLPVKPSASRARVTQRQSGFRRARVATRRSDSRWRAEEGNCPASTMAAIKTTVDSAKTS